MGAWGEKAFQNDSALDWVAELETGGLATLRETLADVAGTGVDEYLHVDDGSRAVAAAEVVATALGARQSATRVIWLEAHRGELTDEDRDLARRAVTRVLEGQSELRELWEEGGADGPWHAEVRALLQALGGDATSEQAAPPTQQEPAGPSMKHEKQALLTFLAARGLEPNAQQVARIWASRDTKEVHGWLARVATITSVTELLDG